MCVHMCAQVYTLRSEESIGSPGTESTGSYELPYKDAEN